jgi:hypothetical protein
MEESGSSVVVIATRLRAGRSGVRIPAEAREWSSSAKTPRPGLEPIQPSVHIRLVPRLRMTGVVPPRCLPLLVMYLYVVDGEKLLNAFRIV